MPETLLQYTIRLHYYNVVSTQSWTRKMWYHTRDDFRCRALAKNIASDDSRCALLVVPIDHLTLLRY